MSNRKTLLALADRCEREEPGRELGAAVTRAWGWLGHPVPDHFITNLGAAMALTDWCIVTISEIAGDGLPMVVLTTGEQTVQAVRVGKALASREAALAMTFTAAALRALAAKEEAK